MEYYNSLRFHANHMVEIPSKYDFHRKFIYGLLPSIRCKVLEYGCTLENTQIESILKCATDEV
jgi:hypothetical protein